MMEEYLNQYVDSAYIIQYLCASGSMVIALCPRGEEEIMGAYIKKLVPRILFITTGMVLVNFIFSILAQYGFMLPGVGTWISYLIGLLIVSFFMCSFSSKARLVTGATVYSLAVIAIALGEALGGLVATQVAGMDSLYFKILANLLLLATTIVITRHPVYPYDISGLIVNVNLICAVLTSLFIVLYDLMRIFVIQNGWSANYQFLLTVVFFLFYVLNMMNYRMSASLCREQSDLLMLRSRVHMEQSAEQMMEISEHNLKELRKIRHDIENQYSYMKKLLVDKDYDTLEAYFHDLTGTFSDAVVPLVDCGNRVLNVILNMEYAKAMERGVKLDILAVVPEQLPIADMDLCKVLTNLIDNGMEAVEAEKIKEPVRIGLKISRDYLYITVRNRTNRKSWPQPGGSTKPDAFNHGLGVEIVKQVAEKYAGVASRKINQGYYVSEVALLLQDRK